MLGKGFSDGRSNAIIVGGRSIILVDAKPFQWINGENKNFSFCGNKSPGD